MVLVSMRKSFKDSLKVLEADIQHANTLVSKDYYLSTIHKPEMLLWNWSTKQSITFLKAYQVRKFQRMLSSYKLGPMEKIFPQYSAVLWNFVGDHCATKENNVAQATDKLFKFYDSGPMEIHQTA